MQITTGTRIGAYEVRSPLGEGAMGVVFRARDTRLQRDVALKFLPDHFAADAERLARFQREAQLLASLNHPNIAHIYGFEQAGDSGCIVMELIEGETLAERIKRGPIAFDETMEIAPQIVEALEAAHARGIVHRDLKPANIKVTPEGKVKVLDFGLAKAFANESIQLSRSNLPTLDSGSISGAIIGTPGYMAPEQARGWQVDKRVDIWAFGCVVFEMLTAKAAFAADDVADAVGAVIHKEPAWECVPPVVLPMLRRCLEKDPKRRLRDIGDALPLTESVPAAAVAAPQKRWLTWGPLALSAILLVILALSNFQPTAGPPGRVRFLIPPPDKTGFDVYLSVSLDGNKVAFTAVGPDRVPHLYLRDLDKIESRLLPGTEGAGSPFWSPDNKFLAFSVGSELKKIDLSGGQPQALGKAENILGLGTWSTQDVILFGHRDAGPLQKVSAAGGVPTAVTMLNTERGDTAHSIPSFLPDGRHFIYFVASARNEKSGEYIGSLDSKPEQQSQTMLMPISVGAVFVPSPDRSSSQGHILFIRDNTLMSQPFDTSALAPRGEPMPIAEQVDSVASYGVFSASSSGVLAYRAKRRALNMPVWVDRTGREVGMALGGALEGATHPALSPDGKRLALVVSRELWVYDLEGRPPIKLTFGGNPASPMWTRDGQRIIYEPNAPEWERVLASLPADGSARIPERVSPMGHLHPLTWTPDGKELIAAQLTAVGAQSETNIVKFAPGTNPAIEPVLATPAQEGLGGAAISPDGRWIAYTSNVTGNLEIWVKPYAREGAPVRVSPNGGFEPLWSKDGRELFYREGSNRMMAVPVDTRAGFNFKPAGVLFEGPFIRAGQPPSYGLFLDGRFLMIRPAVTAPAPITIILN